MESTGIHKMHTGLYRFQKWRTQFAADMDEDHEVHQVSMNWIDKAHVYTLLGSRLQILSFCSFHTCTSLDRQLPMTNRQVNQNSHRTNPRRAKDATS